MMNMTVTHDKVTNVGYLDVAEAAEDAKIRVVDVTDQLGLKTQVLARIDVKNEVFLGVIVEDYPAFRRELHRKFLAAKIEEIINLMMGKLKATFTCHHDNELLHA
jgi:hypothetical protein